MCDTSLKILCSFLVEFMFLVMFLPHGSGNVNVFVDPEKKYGPYPVPPEGPPVVQISRGASKYVMISVS